MHELVTAMLTHPQGTEDGGNFPADVCKQVARAPEEKEVGGGCHALLEEEEKEVGGGCHALLEEEEKEVGGGGHGALSMGRKEEEKGGRRDKQEILPQARSEGLANSAVAAVAAVAAQQLQQLQSEVVANSAVAAGAAGSDTNSATSPAKASRTQGGRSRLPAVGVIPAGTPLKAR
jgi:hypothetical protein